MMTRINEAVLARMVTGMGARGCGHSPHASSFFVSRQQKKALARVLATSSHCVGRSAATRLPGSHDSMNELDALGGAQRSYPLQQTLVLDVVGALISSFANAPIVGIAFAIAIRVQENAKKTKQFLSSAAQNNNNQIENHKPKTSLG